MPLPQKYGKITHRQRISVVYSKVVHSMPLKQIEATTGVKYNTIRNLLRTYRLYGRTNKKACLSSRLRHP